MTEEMLKSITVAEEKATEIRQQANDRAAEIVASAELQATRSKQSSAEVCKAYKETQLKLVQEDAQQVYDQILAENTRKAEAYCLGVFQQNAAVNVQQIVRRIVSGDC